MKELRGRIPQGGEKFAQIGQNGWNAILMSLFEKITLPSRAVVVIVDVIVVICFFCTVPVIVVACRRRNLFLLPCSGFATGIM